MFIINDPIRAHNDSAHRSLANCLIRSESFPDHLYAPCRANVKPTRSNIDGPITAKEVRERMEMEWNGQWYNAKRNAADGERRKIHYTTYNESWDEWLGPETTRKRKESPLRSSPAS